MSFHVCTLSFQVCTLSVKVCTMSFQVCTMSFQSVYVVSGLYYALIERDVDEMLVERLLKGWCRTRLSRPDGQEVDLLHVIGESENIRNLLNKYSLTNEFVISMLAGKSFHIDGKILMYLYKIRATFVYLSCLRVWGGYWMGIALSVRPYFCPSDNHTNSQLLELVDVQYGDVNGQMVLYSSRHSAPRGEPGVLHESNIAQF